MANVNNKNEPSTAPNPDRWYNLTLGSSFKDHHPSSNFCTLRYEFKPASIDKNQPGTLQKCKDNKVMVEFHNNQAGKPKTTFEGISEDYKDNDAVLFFDGESFRLERLHRAVKRLKHLRLPGESSASASASAAVAGAGIESCSSPPPLVVGKGNKFQSFNKNPVPAVPVEVERIEIGEVKSTGPDAKPRNEKLVDHPSAHENASNASPEKMDDLEEQLDILNDDDDYGGEANDGNIDVKESDTGVEVKEFDTGIEVKEFDTGIDINIPHQNDTDDEIADVDASDDEADEGRNAAEALRAQVGAVEEKQEQTSSGSSGSESESSGSASSSSSDSESSDGDSINSI